MQAPVPPHTQPLAAHPLVPNESVPGLSVLTNTHAAPMSVAVSLNRLRERGQIAHGHSQVSSRRPSLERLAKGQLAEHLQGRPGRIILLCVIEQPNGNELGRW